MKIKFNEFLNEGKKKLIEMKIKDGVASLKINNRKDPIDILDYTNPNLEQSDVNIISIINSNVINLDKVDFTKFRNMFEFYAENCNIESLNFDNCKHMGFIDVKNCNLKNISYTNCTKLEEIDLSNNQLTTIPSFEKFDKLKRLDVSNNQISNFPAKLKKNSLSNLEFVYVSQNKLTSLESLYTYTNFVTGDLDYGNQSVSDVELDFFDHYTDIVFTDYGYVENDYWFDFFKYCSTEKDERFFSTKVPQDRLEKIENDYDLSKSEKLFLKRYKEANKAISDMDDSNFGFF